MATTTARRRPASNRPRSGIGHDADPARKQTLDRGRPARNSPSNTAKRSAAVRRAAAPSGPRTLDRNARSVRAIIATDEPVVVYDWERDEQIAEVLIPSGMVTPPKMKLRTDHARGSARAVIGRVTDFAIRPNEIEATLHFSGAADAMDIFDRVADGAIDAVSIGATYRMRDTIDLEPGESRVVDGTRYTAADIPKRLVLKWTPDETSVVDEGADPRAVIRSKTAIAKPPKTATKRGAVSAIRTNAARVVNSSHRSTGGRSALPATISTGETTMPVTRRTKRSKPARARDRVRPDNATTTATTRARRTERTAAHADPAADTVATDSGDDGDDDSADDEADVVRGERGTVGTVGVAGSPSESAEVRRMADRLAEILGRADAATRAANPAATPDQFAEGQRAERARVAEITELGADVPQLAQRAISEGWTVDRFSRAALEHHMGRSNTNRTRQSGDGIDRAPAGHTARGDSVETLQAALLMSVGTPIENKVFRNPTARAFLRAHHCDWVGSFNATRNSARYDQTLERAQRLASSHPVRIAERMLELLGKRRSSDSDEEMVARAFSNPYMPRVFGSIITVGLIQGFLEYPDFTVGIVDEADWPDFRQVQPIGLSGTQGLQRHTRRTEAKHIDMSEYGEPYAVSRYTGQFALDEMDLIDGSLGLNEAVPQQMGRLARELRPDLYVAVLQTNPVLSDNVQLFHASRGNLLTGNAWSLDALEAAEGAMAQQTVATKTGLTKTRNLQAGYVLCPRRLRPKVKRDLRSTQIVSGNTTDRGANNWAAGEYDYRSDGRLDIGVIDPRTKTGTTGNTARWYAIEQSGRAFLQFGFLRGKGRAPTMKGQAIQRAGSWGVEWDILFDVGIGILSPQAAIRCDA